MKRDLLLVSGILGPKREGNQSLLNTIGGFLRAGYRVHHLSLVSRRDARHAFGPLLQHPRYRLVGFPAWFLGLLRLVGRLRRRRPTGDASATFRFPALAESVDLGVTEIDRSQVVVALAGAVIDVFRALLMCLDRRPSLVYGYEVGGSIPASVTGRLLGITTVLRYQGTYLTRRNRWTAALRFHARVMRGHADGIVMANDGTRGDEVLRRLGVPGRKVFFEPNGIDRRPWEAGTSGDPAGVLRTRRELAGDGDGFLLGIFTRFYPYKRVDRAVVLLERFRREGVRVRLVVGGGGGPLEAPLRSLVDRLGLAPAVNWMGAIPFDRMPDCYRACDAVLVLNDCANTGNQVLECIHLGVPLVAIDDGINSRLFRDCPRALFVAPADLDRLGWADLERVIGNRGSPCRSPYLRSWDTRMRLEVEWIEGIPRGRGRA